MVETKIALALRSMECVAAKDLDGVMAFFTEDAVFFDPHYPKSRMQGHVEIADGIRWGFNGLKKLGFDVIETYESADGKSVVVSVRTAHVLPNGKPLNFPQLLLFEFEGQLIKSLQAYVQYEPHGMVGVILKIERLKAALVRWKKRIS